MTTPTVPETPYELPTPRQAIRTPRAAAVAGIVFGALLIIALVLVRGTVPATPDGAATWLSDTTGRNAVLAALSLVPFAGIAFLWFIGVVRDRIGELEDRFFATVFLRSGLLFVAMLFVSAAAAAGMVGSMEHAPTSPSTLLVWRFSRYFTYTILTIYAMRMAAVFVISTSTIMLRTGALPKCFH